MFSDNCSFGAPELYQKYNKLNRLLANVDKNLAYLGKIVDLGTADFKTLEKYASLISTEKLLQSTMNSYKNSQRRAFAFGIFRKIADRKPTVYGELKQKRFFNLIRNTLNGYRMQTKQNLAPMFKLAYPELFIVSTSEALDYRLSETDTVAPISYTDEKGKEKNGMYTVHDLILILLWFCAFLVCGIIYGYKVRNSLTLMLSV